MFALTTSIDAGSVILSFGGMGLRMVSGERIGFEILSVEGTRFWL